MTTLVEPADLRQRGVRVFPTVTVAGAAWPLYKVQALVVALVVGLAAFAATGSGQVTMWLTATALVTVWWTQRLRTGRAAC